MIQTKQDLKLYLTMDAVALWQDKEKPFFLWNGRVSSIIWRYERYLRLYEYHLNNHHCIREKIYQYIYTWYGLKLGFDIPPNVIGPGLDLVHIGNVVISPKSRIGKNCMIYQNVTIGEEDSCAPEIGNYVCILPGAKVFGNIKIGDNVMIGANAVVCKDVPSGARVAGVPARILNMNGNEYAQHFDNRFRESK